MGLGRVKTPTCNLRVEIPTRFRQLENQKYLRPLLGEDDRENNSAHSWLVHVFTQPGSKTEVSALPRYFCFTPQSRHQLSRRRRPLGATNRLMHRSKSHCYSITSSARPSSESGGLIPSASALLRFKNNSTFVLSWTGRSAGFSPFKIRPA